MNKCVLTTMSFLISLLTYSQAMYRMYPSDALDEERQIKILKPRNYNANPEKTYPLVIVLDGDYLFEPTAGNVDYLSYWDQIPESFVVGVNMDESRYDDTAIDRTTGFPEARALKYMDFLMEIRETMLDEYRVAPFTIIVGKDISANLVAFYLLRKKVAVDGFIQIAPQYTQLVKENLIDKIAEQEEYSYFYVATSEERDETSEFIATMSDSLFSGKEKLHVKHDVIKGTNKYSVAPEAISKGLLYVFQEYSLIDEQELYKEGIELEKEMASTDSMDEQENKKEKRKKSDKKLVQMLEEKYDFIREVYGIEMKLRLIDIATIASYLTVKEDWEQMIDLGEMASKEHPDLLYGDYLQGKGYRGTGRDSRSLKAFNRAYNLEPAAGISQVDVLDEIESLQQAEDKD